MLFKDSLRNSRLYESDVINAIFLKTKFEKTKSRIKSLI